MPIMYGQISPNVNKAENRKVVYEILITLNEKIHIYKTENLIS